MSTNAHTSTMVIYGADYEVRCNVPVVGMRRVSDVVNQLSDTMLVDAAEINGPDNFGTYAALLAVNRRSIAMVIPVREERDEPPREWKVDKRKVRVRLALGRWVIEGDLGFLEVNLDAFLNQEEARFIPITEAKIWEGGTVRQEPVVLVAKNQINLISVTDDLT